MFGSNCCPDEASPTAATCQDTAGWAGPKGSSTAPPSFDKVEEKNKKKTKKRVRQRLALSATLDGGADAWEAHGAARFLFTTSRWAQQSPGSSEDGDLKEVRPPGEPPGWRGGGGEGEEGGFPGRKHG